MNNYIVAAGGLAVALLLAKDSEPVHRLSEAAIVFEEITKNRTIVTTGVTPPKAAAKLLALLDRYSKWER